MMGPMLRMKAEDANMGQRHGRHVSWIASALLVLLGVALAAACGSNGAPSGHDLDPRVFVNGGFTAGAVGAVPPAPWVLTDFLNPYSPNATTGGVTLQTPQTLAGLNLEPNGGTCAATNNCQGGENGVCTAGICEPTSRTITLQGTGVPDPTVGAGLTYCRYGNRCALINQLGSLTNVNELSQMMTVAAGDVDPTDNKVHVRLVVAPVLENPAHNPNEQPYFFVQITNVTQGTVLYSNFNFSNQVGVPWTTVTIGGNVYQYTNWQLIDVAPGSPALNIGEQVELQLIAAGCSLGGHFGELYVDGIGTTIPGLFVGGSGPTQANPGTLLTYNLNYKNGSPAVACSAASPCANLGACVTGVCAETGAVIDFTTPPGTTFSSITPPAGAVCVSPPVGTAGTIVCTFAGPIPAGGSGAFAITVMITATTTGSIVCGNYQIGSTQEQPLLGNSITTYAGCTLDTECPAGDWCDISLNLCTPTLANGVALPSDNKHTVPVLNGQCNAAAAKLVCTSQVCDTDNKCGLLNGDGPCTVALEAECRSAVCDPKDMKCGLANGDGTCTLADGPTFCRSGDCSANGLCLPAGTCDVDADCLGGNWCFEATHTCTAKIANGAPLPNDPTHTSPTLDGTCATAGVAGATLVCVSGVCDTDNKCGIANGDPGCLPGNGANLCRSKVCDKDDKCGLANGDGPCVPVTNVGVCRSGACSMLDVCEPSGGCEEDADCAAPQWCNESVGKCEAPLANGTPIPTDATHTNPTLTGACTAAAGKLVCAAGVCDATNNECGYANGDGSCTVTTGPMLCQSGTCSANGTVCVAATGGCAVDADCSSTQYCNTPTFLCTAKLANGVAVPTVVGHTPALTGMCTSALGVGAIVCVSGVCDTTDSDCGYANGDGTCTSMTATTVCRSGACSTSGVCEPMGGCEVDADCATGNWCDESMHLCTPQVANGGAMPTDTGHMTPTLDGKCNAAAAVLVCTSGVCDMNDNECGYANGDGPCMSADGPTDCRSTICGQAGVCVGCMTSSQCSGSTPACNTTSGECVQCTISATCPSEQPVCNTGPSTCGPCNGDFGSTATLACGSMSEPFCFLTGTNMGQCGMCSTNADCVGHMGNVCDTTSGLCTSGCTTDAQCLSSQWCSAAAGGQGMCEPKLANGVSLPSTPASVATCTATVGQRVCLSTVCDTKSNQCGYGLGDGPCTTTAECTKGACNSQTMLCALASDAGADGGAACHVDTDCSTGNFCGSTATCTPTLPTSSTCTRAAQCQSAECSGGVCSVVVSSGGACSVRGPGSEHDDANGGLLGLLFAVGFVGYGRRRRSVTPAPGTSS